MSEPFTILELSLLFKLSKQATKRHLKAFGIPMNLIPRKQCRIEEETIKQFHPELYNSIQLTLQEKTDMPFYSIDALRRRIGKSKMSTWRFIKRNNIRHHFCQNKIIVFASEILNAKKP